MTKNQMLALKPGDKVTMREFRDCLMVWDHAYMTGIDGERLYGVRLKGLGAIYFANEMEHYKDHNDQKPIPRPQKR